MDCSRSVHPRVFLNALIVMALATLSSCARQGAPTGGAKDTTPPGIDSSASTPNFSTRFAQKKIALKFDEWVVLSDVATQVVVSPPLATKPTPKVTLKGKTVTIEFPEEEVLKPNTTYTINFGTAVKDLHENNPAKDLRFVFSTGDFIDSLRVSGSVADAFTDQPVENVTVMLYDNTADSVVRKQKPLYFARANKEGQYTIENVRAGSFKLVAMEDLSANLKWEEGNERIAFSDSLVTVRDSMGGIPRLRLFKMRPKNRRPEVDAKRYGVVKLKYPTLPDTLPLRIEVPGGRHLSERSGDTLLVWYDQPDAVEWQFFADKDTIAVKTPAKADFLKKHAPRFADDAPPPATNTRNRRLTNDAPPAAAAALPARVITITPGKSALLDFNVPVSAIDTAKWLLTYDSLGTRAFSVLQDSLLPRRLVFRHRWSTGAHQMTLLPGAVTDLYGATNQDTLRRIVNGLPAKQLGGLNLTVEDLKPGLAYILQLLNGSSLEEERRFVADKTEQKFAFANLPSATYTAQLIEDRNHNGRWDTGDYDAHRQPEALFTKKLDPLRANWEVEAGISAGGGQEQKKKRG